MRTGRVRQKRTAERGNDTRVFERNRNRKSGVQKGVGQDAAIEKVDSCRDQKKKSLFPFKIQDTNQPACVKKQDLIIMFYRKSTALITRILHFSLLDDDKGIVYITYQKLRVDVRQHGPLQSLHCNLGDEP
ncbi:hypothetical protein T265_03717 [Opisthorchis viverrini]|uniref:Uncharacterized protein n=1 Tax=Opisthorchis viverrini TaxID=6198 RepID=A0A075A2F9_OPIVI|nr:hypothetical protein T265_03717 [Opisthorchis viverrini]KER29700.1 hypothetical protein T265_03717 [Opisthorchis viverrini]